MIFTRFGSPVEIAARCDDYDPAANPPNVYVHICVLDDNDLRTVPLWELRADGGLGALYDAAAAAPRAKCTGTHAHKEG